MNIDGVEIIGVNNKAKKFIMEWLEETDIVDFVNEMSITSYRDFIIYGYNPWDYLKETELNMKEQGFLK